MPSQERIPVFPECDKKYCMDLNVTPAEGRSGITPVHLSIRYCLRKKDYYFGLKESKHCSPAEQLRHRENENAHFNKMTDGNETEGEKHLFSRQPVIPQPNSSHEKQSMADHNSVSTNRAFTALPIKLEIQTTLDKSIHGPNLNSNHQKQSHTVRKGFSSITITAKKNNPQSNHAEIKTVPEPIMSLCRNNNMAFQGSDFSSELHQPSQDKHRHLSLSASRCRTFHTCLQTSSSTPCRACICRKENSHLSSSNGEDRVSFISSIYSTTNQVSPAVISYVDKSLALCLGKIKTSSQNIYKSEMSFKINHHPPSRNDTINKVGTELCRSVSLADRKTIFNLEARERPSFQKQPDILDNDLETKSYARSEYLFKTKETTKDCNELNMKLKHDTKYQLDPPKWLSQGPRSCSAKIKGKANYSIDPWGDSTVFNLETKERTSFQRQPDILDNDLETKSPARSKYLFKTKETTKGCNELNIKLKHDTKYQLDQPKWLSQGPRSCSARIKESNHQVLTPKPDPQLQRGCLSEGKSNFQPERSKSTTFNFIFGKQTPKSENGKQISHKENIAPNGSKWPKSCEKTERDCIEDLPLPLQTMIFQQQQLKENKESEAEGMSLREALELHRPDFISNSQERVHKLELMAQHRKIKQVQVPPKTLQSPLSKLTPKVTSYRRKLFTVPLPLSNNLFKPTERVISEKEMQQRSKRIYNSLPEVKRKKEEEEKKMILLSNRMRAELFKKKLLNQVLQRNAA
ncbi:(E2-independent) E3 ubiquitin-conjugating enzyme FATS [Xenopus laevis]|uniref:ALMS motif domain-containing protein n=2 Tax=Xenopus laevis TaxID=8355 RepID=A0A974CE88_XENLA|nr:(E2-independent) E3 ubiquitin-conjugating enzyme FATS [Xenopus laevis]OCT71605.1 hypothetical protein XELAEV_18034583mg [Xenopus laevis]